MPGKGTARRGHAAKEKKAAAGDKEGGKSTSASTMVNGIKQGITDAFLEVKDGPYEEEGSASSIDALLRRVNDETGSLDEQLVDACERCSASQIRQIRTLLASRASPNAVNSDSERVLYLAIRSGPRGPHGQNVACLKALLDAKADPAVGSSRAKGSRRQLALEALTPLALAVKSAHAEEARLLLAAGAPHAEWTEDDSDDGPFITVFKLLMGLSMQLLPTMDEQEQRRGRLLLDGWCECLALFFDKMPKVPRNRHLIRFASNQGEESEYAVRLCELLLAAHADPNGVIHEVNGTITYPALIPACHFNAPKVSSPPTHHARAQRAGRRVGRPPLERALTRTRGAACAVRLGSD